ncbi:MAG: chloride channel protein [Anaerolineales bacterium]
MAGRHALASRFSWWPLLLPVVGGLIVGAMKQWLIQREKHHGVAGIMQAVSFAGGRIPYRRVPLKALAAVISIGSGASVGPEDPSVQIGSGIGSMIGQLFHMTEDRMRVLVATGAASGIATAFNAPIAGVFFAMELVLGEYESGAFSVLVLGAVTAAVVTRSWVGPNNPAFPVPPYAFHGAYELPFYLMLGFLAAFVSLAYIKALYLAHDWFHESRLPIWARPVLIGFLLGVIGLFVPQILGDGHETTGEILRGVGMFPTFLLLVLALKLILTALSLGSGFVGGVFAPSLLLGAALGGAFGAFSVYLFPGMALQPSAFALVGMAAVLAGAVRAPGTAVMLLFEMTNDYRIFLPLMFSVVVSMFISELLEPESVYTLSLVRSGIRLQRGRDVDVMQALMVKDVMVSIPALVTESTSLREVSEILQRTHVHGIPVVDQDGLLMGVISISDIEGALAEEDNNLDLPVGRFCSRRLLVTYEDETVQQALQRMGTYDVGRLPVVRRDNPRALIGWVSRAAIVRAYKLALIQRASRHHRIEQVRVEALSGADVIEVEVPEKSSLVGRRLCDIPWPHECLVASLQRGYQLLIPHGDTSLQPGDRLAIVVAPEDEQKIYALLRAE